MKTIKKAEFLKSASSFETYKGFKKPEIVLVGRSNVGKSSIINMLSNNSKLAKVSATQGKTKLVNFFNFNDDFILVDLPGYGYATTSKGEKEKWSKIIEDYLQTSKNIKCAILLVDIRHKPTEQDIQMLEYLTYYNISVTVVATKFDKIKKSEKQSKLMTIAKTFNMGLDNIYVTSSENSFGKDTLVERIYQFVDGV